MCAGLYGHLVLSSQKSYRWRKLQPESDVKACAGSEFKPINGLYTAGFFNHPAALVCSHNLLGIISLFFFVRKTHFFSFNQSED